MEARVTTATGRLRKASIAGLATAATAIAVVASAGSAVAFPATAVLGGGGALTPGASVVVFPGVASQSLNDLSLTLKDLSGAGWSNGDFITLQLHNQTAGVELCNTAG